MVGSSSPRVTRKELAPWHSLRCVPRRKLPDRHPAMRCPFCAVNHDRVVDSRDVRGGETVRRRRECLNCNRRFTSYEQIEHIAYRVIKSDGRRQDFDRNKFLSGLLKACEKRPVPLPALEEIVDQAEALLHRKEDREIATTELGNFAIDRLRNLDQVAYVRFASVYRQFEDVDAFMDELRSLIGASRKD